MGYWLVGEKNDDLLRKNANIKWKRWNSKGKGEILLYFRKKHNFGKKCVGYNYHVFGINTPLQTNSNKRINQVNV